MNIIYSLNAIKLASSMHLIDHIKGNQFPSVNFMRKILMLWLFESGKKKLQLQYANNNGKNFDV